MPDDDPIGGRLGSERLYEDPPIGFRVQDAVPLRPPPEKSWKLPNRKKRRNPANQPPQPPSERGLAARTAEGKWREIVSNLVEFAGIMAITTGSWLIRAWLGLIVLGVCLILLGIGMSSSWKNR